MRFKNIKPNFLTGALALLIFGSFYACQKKQLAKETTTDEKIEQKSGGTEVNVNPGLIIGINGHPLNTIEYNASSSTVLGVNNQTQANMVKAMGMTYYRFDVNTADDGTANSESKMLDIIAKCSALNIKVLPMINDKTKFGNGITIAQNYQRGYNQMVGFAQKYGQYFDYFELGNEWELFRELYDGNTHAGQDSSDYDAYKVSMALSCLKGMEEGLKSVLPNKKTIVNTAGYFPTYWMDKMFATAPTINICGWHYYAGMVDNIKNQIGVPNLHAFLWNRYHRPIWYTESGYQAKVTNTQEVNETKSNDWRNLITSEALADPHVEAVIFFELLDRPQRSPLGASNYSYGEENYGWVKFNNYPGKTDAAAYNTWLANPNRYQDWSYKKPAIEMIGPDLIVTDITWLPGTPANGNNIVFTAIVKNVGLAATPAGTILGVKFTVDGNPVGCNGTSTASLLPGQTRQLSANACSPSSWTATSGTHSVVARADDQSRIRESDETNNTRTETINVN